MSNDLIMLVGFGTCILLIGWVLYMMTFRTEDFLRLWRMQEEQKKASHERMGKLAGGAAKAVLFGIKRWKK